LITEVPPVTCLVNCWIAHTHRDIDAALCRIRNKFYQQFGSCHQFQTKQCQFCMLYWPCYRHIFCSLPSVETRNYLGRSVPPALQCCSSTVVELPLTDDTGKIAMTRELILVLCCCLFCLQREKPE